MIKENFEYLCKARGIAPTTAMKNIGVSYTSYLNWSDNSKPHPRTLKKIAEYFDVTVSWLEADHDFDDPESISWNSASHAEPPENESKLPVYGTISAGRGVLAVEDIIGWAYADEEYHDGQHFWLSISGVSMEPELRSGDLVLIHRQPELDNGCIGAFLYGGEGFVKKYIANGEIRLHSLNPVFSDIVITPETSEQFEIIGRVVEVRRRY